MPYTPENKQKIDDFLKTDHKGKPIDRKALLHPNPMIARVLVARIMTLDDGEKQALKSILTPETAPALKKLLPELAEVIQKGISNA